MRSFELFSYCPRCGKKYSEQDWDSADALFACTGCGYCFYQTSVPSATVVIPAKNSPGKILLLKRATDPNRGKLALPGRFLRYDEDPAEAARREAKEETLLDVTIERLLCATLVNYEYQSTLISIFELAYLARPVGAALRVDTPEASCLAFYDARELLKKTGCLAFPEQRRVLETYEASSMHILV